MRAHFSRWYKMQRAPDCAWARAHARTHAPSHARAHALSPESRRWVILCDPAVNLGHDVCVAHGCGELPRRVPSTALNAQELLSADGKEAADDAPQDCARTRRRSRPVKRGLPELFHRSGQRASEGGERGKEKEGEREGRGKRRRRERGMGGGGGERP